MKDVPHKSFTGCPFSHTFLHTFMKEEQPRRQYADVSIIMVVSLHPDGLIR
jgi:hypothetical protein